MFLGVPCEFKPIFSFNLKSLCPLCPLWLIFFIKYFLPLCFSVISVVKN